MDKLQLVIDLILENTYQFMELFTEDAFQLELNLH
jgi:hypothetical protein